MFVRETPLSIEVRAGQGFHDRHLIIDGRTAYQSGASFKDGAATAPTTLTPVLDLFDAVRSTCEALWGAATPRFPAA